MYVWRRLEGGNENGREFRVFSVLAMYFIVFIPHTCICCLNNKKIVNNEIEQYFIIWQLYDDGEEAQRIILSYN